uniref:Calponin-homology (CH) domain-containing protein n=1 Tax=Sinocyclocheilus rhinocerous TaxID=307959 RepID=A0A673IUF4_9TELE
MPAILVASKMKSGLPKPVYGTALPIPARVATHQKPVQPSLITLKSPIYRQQSQSMPFPHSIYTDWANHYLAKSGHTRLIKDLQQDVADGVLLAEIIQVVANEKIADINGFPESRSQMIENIDACLGFLAAKGVNIKGLCAEGDKILFFFCQTRDPQWQSEGHFRPVLHSVTFPAAAADFETSLQQCSVAPEQPGPPMLQSCPKPQTDLQSRYYSPTHKLDSFFIDKLHSSWIDTSVINFK